MQLISLVGWRGFRLKVWWEAWGSSSCPFLGGSGALPGSPLNKPHSCSLNNHNWGCWDWSLWVRQSSGILLNDRFTQWPRFLAKYGHKQRTTFILTQNFIEINPIHRYCRKPEIIKFNGLNRIAFVNIYKIILNENFKLTALREKWETHEMNSQTVLGKFTF